MSHAPSSRTSTAEVLAEQLWICRCCSIGLHGTWLSADIIPYSIEAAALSDFWVLLRMPQAKFHFSQTCLRHVDAHQNHGQAGNRGFMCMTSGAMRSRPPEASSQALPLLGPKETRRRFAPRLPWTTDAPTAGIILATGEVLDSHVVRAHNAYCMNARLPCGFRSHAAHELLKNCRTRYPKHMPSVLHATS